MSKRNKERDAVINNNIHDVNKYRNILKVTPRLHS